jgi:hypothetical protein
VKNRISVQPCAREGWTWFIIDTPSSSSTSLPVHDIPDGSFKLEPFDPDYLRMWPDNNGVNILGTPVGTFAFVESFMQSKGLKHRQLLDFIKEVAEAGYSRQAIAMFIGAAAPRKTNIIKLIQKSARTIQWI